MKDKINLLWLSDIHLKELTDYPKGIVEEYLESFHNYIDNLRIELNFLVLSGDISYSGKQNQYEDFTKYIIDPLKTKYPPLQVISIAGNHDVNLTLSNFDFFKIEGDKVLVENKEAYLTNESNYQKVKEHFVHYTYFTKKHNEGLTDSLFGITVDNENKILFIQLNSAWFSIGPEIDNSIIEYVKSEKITDIKLILKLKNKLNEYGNQIVGLGKINEILQKVKEKEYKRFLKVIIQHHPPSWLEWNQLYNEKDVGLTKLFQLYKASDLLLTGHEHVPVNVLNEKLGDNLTHIKGGMFLPHGLDESITTESVDLSNCRFSIIEINNGNNEIIENRHRYDNFEKKWIPFTNPNEKIKFEPIKAGISLKEIEKISAFYKSDQFFKKYLHDSIKHQNITVKQIGDTNPSLNAHYWISEEKKLYINANGCYFENLNDQLSNLITNNLEQIEFVYFLVLDVEKQIEFMEKDKLKIEYDDMKCNIDMKFNVFRHHYFDKLSPDKIKDAEKLKFCLLSWPISVDYKKIIC